MDAIRDFDAARAVTAVEGIVPCMDYYTLTLARRLQLDSTHSRTALGLRVQRPFEELTGSRKSDELIRFYDHPAAR